MNSKITLTVNGAPVSAEVEPRMHLADFLRERLRLTSIHLGCEHGVCGACTIFIDGAPARSCIALAASLDGADIRTLEGMKDDPLMLQIKESFHQEHGLQCGFCTPGMLISSWDLLSREGNVDEAQIRRDMSGNLCRCTGYQGIVRSIRAVAETLPVKSDEDTW
jgi:aerobic carbon-monoxide dehydrogenase small subunit